MYIYFQQFNVNSHKLNSVCLYRYKDYIKTEW